jgi:signal transduction histidine kinase
MTVFGFVIAVVLFCHYKRHLQRYQRRYRLDEGADAASAGDGAGTACASAQDWHDKWHERWERQMRRDRRRWERRTRRHERRARKHGATSNGTGAGEHTGEPDEPTPRTHEEEVLRRAKRRARAEIGFYSHMMSYLGVMAFLALINLMTTRYPWFLWPALGWGIGLFSHYMATFGSRMVRERYFDPVVEREVRREKAMMQTEKQATIEELSSTIAHEIRNPIAAAKSLVGQMGEDPTSVENVEYAKVALEELDRVERRISHLLRYAKEEDYTFDNVNLAAVVDSALTQMRAKLDGAKVNVARNYIGGPTVNADSEKMRQVFVNVLDNAIDALGSVAEGRRIDLFIENGGPNAVVRVRDNGCGIAAEKIERIFNPFFTTKETGTGLGMAISKKIVEAHQGTIAVASEPGQGTEFAVTLPRPQ